MEKEPTNETRRREKIIIIIIIIISTQPNMNSIIKTAAKITEELRQPNEKSDAE